MGMHFEKELKETFLKVAAGEIEPEAWAQWWNSHKAGLQNVMKPYTQTRIMPPEWSADYYWMVKTQKGVARYFYDQGRPVKCSDYYEKKAREEETQSRRQAIEAFHRRTAPVRQPWEAYLAAHPTETVTFDWRSLLGTPPAQKPPRDFPYKKISTSEQWKETGAEIKLRLKENIQAKIAPLAKAYGMKKTGPQTFVRENNGLIFGVSFIGYFRGGGYERMRYSVGPLYAIHTGTPGIPAFIADGELFRKMDCDWGVIQYITEGPVTADRVEKINAKFDDILTFLAEGLFPEWQKIGSLETYFAKERLDYLKAAQKGPVDPHTGRTMWEVRQEREKDPWRLDDYLLGVWDLLSGREKKGYGQLAQCVEKGADYMKQADPGACNDKRDPMAVLYYNAELFLRTGEIADTAKRRQAILDTYEDVCRFMRYYHGLSPKVERSCSI